MLNRASAGIRSLSPATWMVNGLAASIESASRRSFATNWAREYVRVRSRSVVDMALPQNSDLLDISPGSENPRGRGCPFIPGCRQHHIAGTRIPLSLLSLAEDARTLSRPPPSTPGPAASGQDAAGTCFAETEHRKSSAVRGSVGGGEATDLSSDVEI